MKEKSIGYISGLDLLLEMLSHSKDQESKGKLLDDSPLLKKFGEENPGFSELLARFSSEQRYLFKSILAIGEGPVVFYGWNTVDDPFAMLTSLAETLKTVECYYKTIGGIIGYHTSFIKLAKESHECSTEDPPGQNYYRYYHPTGLDISDEKDENLYLAIKWGINTLPRLGEIYPVGGAGDRLDLKDVVTGDPLPAAMLNFTGHTLIELLIRDVWGKEYLHYKLTGTQVTVPIALMTSPEKNNDTEIKNYFDQCRWFFRGADAFKFFEQPLVPVITVEGHWSMKSPLVPVLKPGGHGVMWKLAADKGVFKWFKEKGARKLLVRQVNNPIAGIDHGLQAFTGLGTILDKYFGFCSCKRVVGTAEGVNVLIESENNDSYSYVITNVEYTDFKKRGIEDQRESAESPYSQYPSNTNILFADLLRVEEVADKVPVPGMVINTKSLFPYTDPKGCTRMVKGGRLESTMQNIADKFEVTLPYRVDDTRQQIFDTFVTYNSRKKTISVTKNKYIDGNNIIETPVGAFYDLMSNNHELLKDYCQFTMPLFSDVNEFLSTGPSVLFLHHPALGPNWSIIAQKIRDGKISKFSELQLEIAEVDIENLDLDGSLLVNAERIYGIVDESGKIVFSNEVGKLTLKNVKVKNRGIDRNATREYWKNEIIRHEALEINIVGNGEFFAKDVTFEGGTKINVPDGCRLVVSEENGKPVFREENVTGDSWKYSFDYHHRIALKIKSPTLPLGETSLQQ